MTDQAKPPAFTFDLDGTLIDSVVSTRAGVARGAGTRRDGTLRMADPQDLLAHLDEVGVRVRTAP
jgi:phosphoserine phosphatase